MGIVYDDFAFVKGQMNIACAGGKSLEMILTLETQAADRPMKAVSFQQGTESYQSSALDFQLIREPEIFAFSG